MRIRRFFALFCALPLLLAGCGGSPALPEKAADGTPWGEDWTTLGGVLGVEPPDSGLTLRETNTSLEARGMSYAVWALGEPQPYTSADGGEAEIYDAQLAVLLSRQGSPEDAEKTAAEWIALGQESYEATAQDSGSFNGIAYSILEYRCPPEDNPYGRGASASGAFGNYAVCMELSCLPGFDGSPRELLTGFLLHTHCADKGGRE